MASLVHDAVAQLSQLSRVPAVGGSHQIAGDALKLVNVGATAFRAHLKVGLRIFVSAGHATVAVVVHLQRPFRRKGTEV